MGHHQHLNKKLRRAGVGRERFIQTLYAREANVSLDARDIASADEVYGDEGALAPSLCRLMNVVYFKCSGVK